MNSLDADAWRPPLLVWAGALLTMAWALQFRMRRIDTAATGVLPKRRLLLVAAPTIAALLIVLSLALPWSLPTLNRVLEPKWPATLSSTAVTVKLSIPAMDCGTCVRGVDLVLRKQRGLEKAVFSLEKKEAIIWYDPLRASRSSIIESLKAHGLSSTAVE